MHYATREQFMDYWTMYMDYISGPNINLDEFFKMDASYMTPPTALDDALDRVKESMANQINQSTLDKSGN